MDGAEHKMLKSKNEKTIVYIFGILAPIIIFFILLIGIPFFLKSIRRYVECVRNFPEFPENIWEWYSFWVANIGSAVSVAVSFSAFYQSWIHKQEKEKMEADQKRLVYLLLDANFIINKIDINFKSDRSINESEGGNRFILVEFQIQLMNRGYSLIKNINISNITIEIDDVEEKFGEDDIITPKNKVRNEGENTYLVFACRMNVESSFFRYFSAFYQYNYNFYPNCDRCRMVLKEANIELLGREINESTGRNLFEIELNVIPETINQIIGEYQIEHYSYKQIE